MAIKERDPGSHVMGDLWCIRRWPNEDDDAPPVFIAWDNKHVMVWLDQAQAEREAEGYNRAWGEEFRYEALKAEVR